MMNELEIKRKEVMNTMLEWLFVLRSALKITQEQLAYSVGMSRQTYSSYELKKKELTWSAFLSLFLFFLFNEKSRILLNKKPGYIYTVFILLNANVKDIITSELYHFNDERTEVRLDEIFDWKYK